MTTDELLTLLRSELHDVADPQLWSDDELTHYLDEGQNMFCRLTLGIPDAVSSITQIKVVTGQKFSSISPKILKIRHAELVSDSRELQILNFEDRESQPMLKDDYGNVFTTLRPSQWSNDNLPGPVRGLITNMTKDKVRVVQVPAADDTVQLIVYRLPLRSLVDTDPEINEQHHRYLLDWAKHLAYSKQDAETIDKTKADNYKAAFYEYCDQAKKEQERREHKYRSMAYGGL